MQRYLLDFVDHVDVLGHSAGFPVAWIARLKAAGLSAGAAAGASLRLERVRVSMPLTYKHLPVPLATKAQVEAMRRAAHALSKEGLIRLYHDGAARGVLAVRPRRAPPDRGHGGELRRSLQGLSPSDVGSFGRTRQ
ncbi:MAG: hypothetical protein M3394_02830 [Actinomycetota bacterium]|nr:hypothetical protein [Actinomycetota bacterium]